MKKIYLVFQYFNQKTGPEVYQVIPDELDNSIIDRICRYMDIVEKGISIFREENKPAFTSLNYSFEIDNPNARGKSHYALLSILVPINENPINYKRVIIKYGLKIKNNKTIYKALTNYEDNRINNIIENCYYSIVHKHSINFSTDSRDFAIPRVLCSRCITFEACRWNGKIISNKQVSQLKKYVEFISPCPEVEIGLGVPRSPLILEIKGGIKKLVQPEINNDVTEQMTQYALNFTQNYIEFDGIILKSKSPSCGLKVKIISEGEKKGRKQYEMGYFARIVSQNYPTIPTVDENYLIKKWQWENFLTRIYTIAAFRGLKKNLKLNSLIEFQTRNKLLFLGFNKELMREMGNILANQKKNSFDEIFHLYEKLFFNLINSPMNIGSHIYVIQHAYGYFKTKISLEEKKFFLNSLKQLESGIIDLKTIIYLLRGWIIRFNETYLAKQTYFQPFPEYLSFNAKNFVIL